MKIYGDVLSPFVRMCLVTAHEAGLKDKVSNVKTAVKPSEVNAELERMSPIGKIPVLALSDGSAVYDSRVIMEYLAHAGGNTGLFPAAAAGRFRTLTLLALAQGIAEAAVGLRYETFARPESARWPDYAERLRARINAGLDAIERDWQDALDSATAGSIALACTLGYVEFRHTGLNWRDKRPRTAAFTDRFWARDSVKAWPLG